MCTWEEGQRPEYVKWSLRTFQIPGLQRLTIRFRKNNRENLEQLPKLIQKLTEEVNELKSSNLALIENIRYSGTTASPVALPENLSLVTDIQQSHLGARAGSVAYSAWGMFKLCSNERMQILTWMSD